MGLALTRDETVQIASPSSDSWTRPGFSFLVGTCVVVAVLIACSALFSVCYHCARVTRERRAAQSRQPLEEEEEEQQAEERGSGMISINIGITVQDHIGACNFEKLDLLQCPPLVYMPGAVDVPTFIAIPRPLLEAATYGG